MTDRELLELAAKAAGLIIVDEDDDLTLYVIDQYYKKNGDEYGERWAPLEDDGDALRLAVRLGILLRTDFIKQLAEFMHQGMDHCTATRRAIVRTAAEIGRTKSAPPPRQETSNE